MSLCVLSGSQLEPGNNLELEQAARGIFHWAGSRRAFCLCAWPPPATDITAGSALLLLVFILLLPPLPGPFFSAATADGRTGINLPCCPPDTSQLDIPAASGIVGKSGDRVSRRRPLRAPGDRSPICDGAIEAGEIAGDRLAGPARLRCCNATQAGSFLVRGFGGGHAGMRHADRCFVCCARSEPPLAFCSRPRLSAASGPCSSCATRESEGETFQMSRCLLRAISQARHNWPAGPGWAIPAELNVNDRVHGGLSTSVRHVRPVRSCPIAQWARCSFLGDEVGRGRPGVRHMQGRHLSCPQAIGHWETCPDILAESSSRSRSFVEVPFCGGAVDTRQPGSWTDIELADGLFPFRSRLHTHRRCWSNCAGREQPRGVESPQPPGILLIADAGVCPVCACVRRNRPRDTSRFAVFCPTYPLYIFQGIPGSPIFPTHASEHKTQHPVGRVAQPGGIQAAPCIGK